MRPIISLAALILFAGAARADYELDYTDQVIIDRTPLANLDHVAHRVYRCWDRFDQGVVRSWYLKERNTGDFRRSYHNCRNMAPDGTLESETERNDHFFHDGDGTTGSSLIPMDRLPVGVRFRWHHKGLSLDSEITDLALLYNDAADIAARDSGYQATAYALGRAGKTSTRYCGDGYVMTGVFLWERYAGTGGAQQSEIVGIGLECTRLVLR